MSHVFHFPPLKYDRQKILLLIQYKVCRSTAWLIPFDWYKNYLISLLLLFISQHILNSYSINLVYLFCQKKLFSAFFLPFLSRSWARLIPLSPVDKICCFSLFHSNRFWFCGINFIQLVRLSCSNNFFSAFFCLCFRIGLQSLREVTTQTLN